MIVTGCADRVGAPALNLSLSQRRATAVLKALLDHGLPADRFQVLAKGETELAVPTEEGIAEGENRRVEITWR
jgi:outer membrane protein OmpA-like peptidoglycan-associated protein